jgi:hypothetical protein
MIPLRRELTGMTLFEAVNVWRHIGEVSIDGDGHEAAQKVLYSNGFTEDQLYKAIQSCRGDSRPEYMAIPRNSIPGGPKVGGEFSEKNDVWLEREKCWATELRVAHGITDTSNEWGVPTKRLYVECPIGSWHQDFYFESGRWRCSIVLKMSIKQAIFLYELGAFKFRIESA